MSGEPRVDRPGGRHAPRATVAGVSTLTRRIDAALAPHVVAIGHDLAGYRHHAYRMASFCVALAGDDGDGDAAEKIAVAAALHDVGIWTAGTFDYIDPSVDAAVAHLERSGRAAWMPEVTAMIREHHRLTPSRATQGRLVESFRRADLVDLSLGTISWGLPRPFVRRVRAAWPNAGFHRRLALLALRRLRTHPWDPLPMLRL